MLFNSIDFAIFLPIVFILYWFVFKKISHQNLLIVLSSYIFYGWWDWRFLILIIFSTLLDFLIGIKLVEVKNLKKRKLLLWTSIVANLGFLFYFKYFNFFIDSFSDTFLFFGLEMKTHSLNIVLPVGISFYTFQTLSYTIDIYNQKLKPSKNLISFAAFVCFFPQLVAGPIERAKNLLPQFYKKREFNYTNSVNGMRQILWGLFKKMVIADNCAEYVNIIFNNSSDFSGSTLTLGAILFSFQIYGDFSGYSDIAIGTSRLFGFNLKQNFAFPYFSRDIAEFWRRWHISLSTWFRDYLYIPLGGSRGSIQLKTRNVFIIFIVSGFWHGANWTYIVWGALNAIYFFPVLLKNKNRNNMLIVAQGRLFPEIKDFFSILKTFSFTVFAWIFFRSKNISSAIDYISKIFTESFFSIPNISFQTNREVFVLCLLIFFFTAIEWLGRENQYAIENLFKKKRRYLRWSFYSFLVFLISMFTQTTETPFIYFQF